MIRRVTELSSLYNPIKQLIRYKCFPVNFTYYLESLPTVQFSKLSNGFNIATEERESYNACIGFFSDSGSRYENPDENGISHFFEHIAFKGTGSKSKTVVEDQMSQTGARFKCYTTREMVGYYAECLCEDVPCVFEILSDCLFKNAFSLSEIELQKCIVYLEMQQHDRNSRDFLDDYLHSAAFQGTPLAQSVMGPTCNLYKFNRDTIFSYRAKTSDPSRMVLVGVGGIKHEQMLQLASQSLDKLPGGKCCEPYPYRYTGSEIRYRDDSIPVAHLAVAVEGPPFCSADNIIMSLAATIVGGWDKSQMAGLDLGSRVARSASTSHLCESYKSFNLAYKDTGLWGVQFISPKLVIDDMIAVIQDEWMRLCTTITDGEVQRAKQELKTRILTNSESSLKTCMAIGRWILYNKCKTSLYERLCAVDAIETKHVKETCYKYIYDKCPVMAAIGATENVPDYTRLRAGMYWLRY